MKKVLYGIIILLVITCLLLVFYLVNPTNSSSEFVKNGYRYKKMEVPKEYITCEENCLNYTNCHIKFKFTDRYYLYKLFKFQRLTPEEKVFALEKDKVNNFIWKEDPNYWQFNVFNWKMAPLFDYLKSYKIADNYCFNSVLFERVPCTKGIKSIDRLPENNAPLFNTIDDNGVYFKSYDLKKLWKEFENTGIQNIEKQIDYEFDKNANYFFQKANY